MIVEQVKFTVSPKLTTEELLQAKRLSDVFLKNQSGFRYREFNYCDDEQCWIDRVYWGSLDEAKSAADGFPNAPECTAFMGAIGNVISFEHIDEVKLEKRDATITP
ncbi:hypothetical protein [Fangia hongkongensis]|uniref:hypothetical protein n=1 Tax=Fangia hongkongensis TaxID=270495 RepID=UPI0003808910|nr:hypothetical protein [Fangia hongkongensis]MBK2123618.1 hypothetical protein [Fangia hongkongensis]